MVRRGRWVNLGGVFITHNKESVLLKKKKRPFQLWLLSTTFIDGRCFHYAKTRLSMWNLRMQFHICSLVTCGRHMVRAVTLSLVPRRKELARLRQGPQLWGLISQCSKSNPVLTTTIMPRLWLWILNWGPPPGGQGGEVPERTQFLFLFPLGSPLGLKALLLRFIIPSEVYTLVYFF